MAKQQLQAPASTKYARVEIKMGTFIVDGAEDVDSDPDLVARTGSVEFTPNVDFVFLKGEDRALFFETIPVKVDESGEAFVNLIANDVDSDPAGWSYKMVVRPDGGKAIERVVQVKAGQTHTLRTLMGASQAGVAVTSPSVEWDGTTLVVGGVRGPDLAGTASGTDPEKVAEIARGLLPVDTGWVYLNEKIPTLQEGDWVRARRLGEWVSLQAHLTPREWPAQFTLALPSEWHIMPTATACGVDGGAPIGPIAAVGDSITIWGAPEATTLDLGAANFRNIVPGAADA